MVIPAWSNRNSAGLQSSHSNGWLYICYTFYPSSKTDLPYLPLPKSPSLTRFLTCSLPPPSLSGCYGVETADCLFLKVSKNASMPFLAVEEPVMGGDSPWWRGAGKVKPSMELALFTLEPACHILDLGGGVWATKHFWYWTMHAACTASEMIPASGSHQKTWHSNRCVPPSTITAKVCVSWPTPRKVR